MTTRQAQPNPRVYEVIVNGQGQFGIWPCDLKLPKGWQHVGKSGSKVEAMAYLRELLVDTAPTPLDTRQRHASQAPRAR
jgi:MbtH protein